jgi:hypothetical protein
MVTKDPCIKFCIFLDFDKSVSHQGTHLVSVFSAWRIVMHSGQTQSSVGAASSWMQRKWYTRGHVSQLITTPSLWHNQQNRSAEVNAAGTGADPGDSCWGKRAQHWNSTKMILASIIHLYNTASSKQSKSILVAPKTPFIHRTNYLETIKIYSHLGISLAPNTVKKLILRKLLICLIS